MARLRQHAALREAVRVLAGRRRARAGRTSAGRVAALAAASALAGGSLLAVGASAAPALAATTAPLAITTVSLPGATAGSDYSAALHATGGIKPYIWSLAGGTSLPPGLVFNPTGVINGKAVGPAGTTDFTVQVTDQESPAAVVTAAESITVTVTTLAVTTVSLPAASADVAYSAKLEASGGVGPYTWSMPVGELPDGLVLHATTGVISGTPKVGGDFTFTAEATDSEATPQTASAAESVIVGVAGLVVTTGSTLPTATAGVPYSLKLAASGGITAYQWSLASGSLPAGLKLAKTGVISGTTTATGQDDFTVQVTDAESPAASATEAVSLYVVAPLVVPTLPGGTGYEYDASVQPTGGLGPYSYNITAGSLPYGIGLRSDGEVFGVWPADGTYDFTVAVTDSENPPATVTQAESITVIGVTTCQVTYSATTVGSPLTYQFVLAGGTAPQGSINYQLTDGSGYVTFDNENTSVVAGNGTYSPDSSPTYTQAGGYTPTQAGDYPLVANYSGDGTNAPCGESIGVYIAPATPSITAIQNTVTIETPPFLSFNYFYDAATLSGAYNPTGTITFNLYGPFTGPPTCTNSVYNQTVTVTNGNTSYDTPTPDVSLAAGTYYWTASYSGDANNAAVATSCGDPNEEVTAP